MFKVFSKIIVSKEQERVVKEVVKGIEAGKKEQVLMGATGTGKTFTMAKIIEKLKVPALIITPNKTLTMQLYESMLEFFKKNDSEGDVNLWISVFERYQPEAYLPNRNLYIGKKTKRNNEIEKIRLKTINSLANKKTIVVVSSVASIYGCENPTDYEKSLLKIFLFEEISLIKIKEKIIFLGYKENKNKDLTGGKFYVFKNKIRFMFFWEENVLFEISFKNINSKNIISKILEKNLINKNIKKLKKIVIPASKDYLNKEKSEIETIVNEIRKDLTLRIEELIKENKKLEAERLAEIVKNDIENLIETGTCQGIENYSKYFNKGVKTPFTIIDFFPSNFLTIIDESHKTFPQIEGMYNTNFNRLKNLINNGFRLPSCIENRPLNKEEFLKKTGNILYVSATPGNFETKRTNNNLIEQIIRPTGLLDPLITIRKKTEKMLEEIIKDIKNRTKKNEKTIICTLTIKMSENIADYLQEKGIKAVYVHSKMDVFDRYQAINSLRRGIYDVIIGVNLLKEGIDLPEVSLVYILDADKSGFLRDYRSLIQIIGRASRNIKGRVILYADYITKDIQKAIEETSRRRKIQKNYNQKNNIKPKQIEKEIKDFYTDPEFSNILENFKSGIIKKKEIEKIKKTWKKKMKNLVGKFDFQKAIFVRNFIKDLEDLDKKY